MSEQVLRISPQADLTESLGKISKTFIVREVGAEFLNLVYYDTFDWRLAENGLSLARRGGRLRLVDRRSNEEVAVASGIRRVKMFGGELPQGSLRERLQPLLKERALLARFSLSGTLRHVHLLNSDEKTVVRLTLVVLLGQMGEQRFALDQVILVDVLKGYENCWKKVHHLLEGDGMELLETPYDPVGMVQRTLHIDPAEVAARFGYSLAGHETVDEATRDICLYLRGKIMINIAGTLDDIDIEFLHDLRVGVRRTRSLLSLLKKQLPKKDITRFQDELKWVGTVTGPVRDLDVYLAKEEDFTKMLPAELQGGLPFFFAELRSRRRRELRKLRHHLRSPRFQALLADWETFLRQLPERQDPKGGASMRDLASRIIRKRLARIVRNGRAITPETPDEQVHELRIEGKKFRYLLEFFRSLYDGSLVDEYLKQMKKLQNVLGDFNDCSVQKEVLAGYLQRLDPQGVHTRSTAAALGGLVVHLHEEQRRLRASFAETFDAFATQSNLGLMEQILTQAASGGDEEANV